MEITLQNQGFCGGLDGLEMSVALDLLSHGVRDTIRMNRKTTNRFWVRAYTKRFVDSQFPHLSLFFRSCGLYPSRHVTEGPVPDL